VIDEAEPFEIAEERRDYLLVDMLSGQERKRTEKEEIVQRMIRVLAAEYHFRSKRWSGTWRYRSSSMGGDGPVRRTWWSISQRAHTCLVRRCAWSSCSRRVHQADRS
jgi:hypothetical protein